MIAEISNASPLEITITASYYTFAFSNMDWIILFSAWWTDDCRHNKNWWC